MRLRAAIAVLAFTVGRAAAEPPADIARAQRLYDALQFEGAAQAVAAALLRPGRGPEELAALYRLRGLIHAARDDHARAQADFLRSLALDPEGTLPEGLAPKIVAPFAAAQREQRRLGRLALRARLSPSSLRVEVLGDRARLAQAVLVRYAAAGEAGVLRADLLDGKGVVELPLGALPRGPLRYSVELLGEQGGRLAHLGDLAAPLHGSLGPAPLHRRWWLWAAVGGAVAAGVGLGLGLGLGSRR